MKFEKILKCKDCMIQIEFVWNVKTKAIPVLAGATGTISNLVRKCLSNTTGKHEVKEYRKQVYWTLHTYFGKC
jgi:hypothetical protein